MSGHASGDLGPLLIASIEAVHRHNKGLPLHCPYCLGVVFLDLNEFFRHQSRHNHPSTGRTNG